jgi:hypothetical protein
MITKEAKRIYDKSRYESQREVIKERVRKYRQDNLEKVKNSNKEYYKNNRVELLAKQQEYGKRPEVKAQRRKSMNAAHLALKIDTFIHYSGGYYPSCNCCSENSLDFLTLDHINNDGAAHRKEHKLKGAKIYYWLKSRGYPSGFQVLCWNCNASKGLFGECPHKELVL